MSAHIQVELDALNKAASIANASKIGREWVIAGLNDMWAHCFREKTDTVTNILLAGFFTAPIGPVLEGFGFLERADETTWRVRGTDRYTSLTEKRRRAGQKGGKTTQAGKADASSKNERIPNDSIQSSQANGKSPVLLKQTSSKTPEKPVLLKQTSSKSPENDVLLKQNQALYPRSEKSSPTGKKTSRNRVPVVGGSLEPALGGAGTGPPRCLNTQPRILPGSVEWDEAVARSKAEGWE